MIPIEELKLIVFYYISTRFHLLMIPIEELKQSSFIRKVWLRELLMIPIEELKPDTRLFVSQIGTDF